MIKSKPKDTQLSRALSVLNKLGQIVTAIEDPQDVLEQIAKDAKDVLDADIVDLYEYHQARDEFVIPPVLIGERRNPYVPKYKIFEDDVVYKVVKSGKPQYFKDAQEAGLLTTKFEVQRPDTPDNRFVIRESVLSSVLLPLQAGGEIVGAMFVNYRTSQKFEDEQRDLIESFSNLAAIAIQNSRLWSTQNEQLASLKEIIDVIGTKEDPLSIIMNKTAELFSVNNGSISRLTGDGQYLQHKVRWIEGRLENEIEEEPLPIKSGITGYVVREGKSFRTGDVSKISFYDPWYKSTKSELAIPLKNVFGGIIGVLNLESDLIDFFTKEDENLGESFANAASAAIQQSDLIENIQSLHALTELHNINELLDRILKNLNTMMGENTASSVNLYDKENDNFYSYYGVGPNQEFEAKYLLIPPRKDGTGRYVLNTRKPLYYEDVNHIPEGFPKVRKEAWDQEIKSFAVLPLIYRNEILGALFIHKIGIQTKFTAAAMRILETYAAQTALAIHNTRQRIEIEPLKDILNATVTGNQEAILKIIVEKAVGIMASDYASIWLGDRETGDLVRQAIYVKPEEETYLNFGHTRMRKGQPSINMTVYNTRESIVVSDVTEKEAAGLYHRIYQKARSEIAVPLIYRNEIIGTLNTESQNLGAFSELDMATFRVFADVASSAIKVTQEREELEKANENMRKQTDEIRKRSEEVYHMNYRLERKNANFEALTQIAQELTSNVQRNERDILSIIHTQASQIMDTNNMYIALYDPRTDQVRFELASVNGMPVDIEKDGRWRPRSGGRGRTEWIIHHKEPILSYTRSDSENWYKQPDAEEYIGQIFASWLGVPIVFGDEVLGVIATYNTTEEYKYDPDDLKVLTLMGRQAAIALQNARLIRQLDRRIIELDNIRELGEDLSKATQ